MPVLLESQEITQEKKPKPLTLRTFWYFISMYPSETLKQTKFCVKKNMYLRNVVSVHTA